MTKHHLAFALDYPSLAAARELLPSLAPHVGYAKIGLEMFTREGPAASRELRDAGFDVFLDLKLHDIPATVERAVANACAMGVHLLTVHTSGGPAMLQHAVSRAAREATGLRVVGVTVLTSLDDGDLSAIGCTRSSTDQVLHLARMAWSVGVRAFVCSPREVRSLRQALGAAAFFITPGIRPSGSSTQDQKRVATPASAISDGADVLVIGRPIRDASSPADAARTIVAEINDALLHRGF
jgi:orotidine-5'-phosphate decarboxylase